MRRVVSIVLTLGFVVVSVTGVVLDLRPKGGPRPAAVRAQASPAAGEAATERANQTSKRAFFPRQLHIWSGYLFIIASLVHLVLNWHPLLWAFGLRRRTGAAAGG